MMWNALLIGKNFNLLGLEGINTSTLAKKTDKYTKVKKKTEFPPKRILVLKLICIVECIVESIS
ncbi:hypothetical protein PCORN_18029 [Listeria cornellensis FSL F6-0969]|uniref:Uncharacterized protein n=1 Tax=Listeria cornellensis FSL F6-0969 TaxID=1265820 RepID=W7BQ73_9LIST|nr:hypothetical protein PCORN_18029 [Listeria cornellensis FSL F6-0969]